MIARTSLSAALLPAHPALHAVIPYAILPAARPVTHLVHLPAVLFVPPSADPVSPASQPAVLPVIPLVSQGLNAALIALPVVDQLYTKLRIPVAIATGILS